MGVIGGTPSLAGCRHWIFDMDGTLTVAVHDFDAMREALALPPGVPILESLDALEPDIAAARYAKLDELELYYAGRATPQPGARRLLDGLRRRGARLGIVTRNSRRLADVTLEACGLAQYFAAEEILGRESAAPKPAPDALLQLRRGWRAPGVVAAMVGDYRYDLEAGRAAGCISVYYDPGRSGRWRNAADVTVHDLTSLLPMSAAIA